MKTCFQTSTISSAMFITAMAANPLAVNLASEALGQSISWGTWALAGGSSLLHSTHHTHPECHSRSPSHVCRAWVTQVQKTEC